MLITSFLSLFIASGCASEKEVISNPWLVPFDERHGSTVSRGQMRSMARLAHLYQQYGLVEEYQLALTTAVELYAGDLAVTFELLNVLIEGINTSEGDVSQRRTFLEQLGIDPGSLSLENMPSDVLHRDLAETYLESLRNLETKYEECYRILSSACGQIPYNAQLYYRTAELQFKRADRDDDRNKYKDAINFLKRAIATDSSHLESYRLIALAYERLDDTGRAVRFWRMFEVIYEIAPQVIGEGFITPAREQLHEQALNHIESLEPEESI